ncbi:hemolysin family protein [Micropruina sonneratiae]|uniref:hemolysin family protein n=1 Tax=Micropruina sonneratiae TaxID=2986940 RepID=UPI0022276BF9|nr:hemolysin family protein [Micropruina sp. KQZ13P-5]MCW3157016.1 hemolysin family protein [Micropruina sp. KQZ13P-5]
MNPIVSNILLIFLFIIIGGVFAAAEMALVSLRESQVKQLSTRGTRGRTVANLAAEPNRFLSAVQIGVTLSGFLSAAFGGATLEEPVAELLRGWGVPESVASPVALITITAIISYFSIVIGELTAKRLAMQRAETFAMALAPLVNAIATIARPVIWFLGVSTNFLVRVLGGDPQASREEVTDEELRAMVTASSTLGDEERQIVDEVFAAGQVSLREAMVPRTEADFLAGDLPAHKAIRTFHDQPHSRYPVIGEDVDDVLGFVHVRDLFDLDPAARNAPVRQLVRPIVSLPHTMKILRALSEMRAANAHLVIVSDEYGGTAGIVTMEDLVEELVGDISDEFDEPSQAKASPSSAELDGLGTLEEFGEDHGYVLPEGPYDTVAGFVMAHLGHLPEVGDSIEVDLEPVEATDEGAERFRFTVSELDGRRAARLTLHRLGTAAQAE